MLVLLGWDCWEFCLFCSFLGFFFGECFSFWFWFLVWGCFVSDEGGGVGVCVGGVGCVGGGV